MQNSPEIVRQKSQLSLFLLTSVLFAMNRVCSLARVAPGRQAFLPTVCRSFSSETSQAVQSERTLDDLPSAPSHLGASTSASSSAQHAFNGASAERRRRLRELSSPVYAPDMERKDMIDRIVRVDHSGEYSAVQIYRGQVCFAASFARVSLRSCAHRLQLAVLQGTAEYPLIEVRFL